MAEETGLELARAYPVDFKTLQSCSLSLAVAKNTLG